MAYMENHREIRLNPARLVEGAKTVISVALNYYPEQKLPPEAPHIAYYAYGKDYHLVVKEMLSELWTALFPRSGAGRGNGTGRRNSHPLFHRLRSHPRTLLGLESRTGLDREEHEPDYSRKRFFLFLGRNRHYPRGGSLRHTTEEPLRQLQPLPGSLPDRSTGRSMPSERPKMPLLSHHRKPRRNPCRTSRSPRQPPLRLRHLPGGLPLEPFRPPDSDRGIPSETGFAFSSKRGSKGLFP